ncbi:MAG: hypothetical protein AB1765_10245 [Candidatus Hydrogenedentota bacterium]
MKKFYICLLIIIQIILQSFFGNALYPEAGREGGVPLIVRDFASFPREQSLGNSTIALDNSVSVIYFNPASFVSMNSELILGSMKLHKDEDIYYFAYGTPITWFNKSEGEQSLGILCTRLESNNIYTTDAFGSITGIASMTEDLAVLSYMRKLNKLYIGASINYYHQRLFTYQDSVFDISFGLAGNISSDHKKRFGIVIRNLAEQSIKINKISEKIPHDISLGFAFDFGFNEKSDNITLSISYTFNDIDDYYGAGLEYRLRDSIKLRFGIEEGILSGGIGINYKDLSLDFGCCDLPGSTDYDSLRSNFLSVSATFKY